MRAPWPCSWNTPSPRGRRRAQRTTGRLPTRSVTCSPKRGSRSRTARTEVDGRREMSGRRGPPRRTHGPAKREPTRGGGGPSRRGLREGQNPRHGDAVGGRNTVREARRGRGPVEESCLARRVDAGERTGESVRIAANRQSPIHEVEKVDLDGFGHGTKHQGVIARI